MFGYININRDELSEENKKIYQAYYCGLCQKLKETVGRKGQLLLNYDMTFLIVLLTGLYELTNEEEQFVCALHPTKKRTAYINEATEYAAAMNVILSYQNFEDDWRDEHAFTKRAFSKMLHKDYEEIRNRYPRQVQALEHYMEQLEIAEKQKETNMDVLAGLSGTMLGEVFAWKDDIWSDELRCMGFYMGKFVYLMDAYDDAEEDKKKNNYNPLMNASIGSNKDFETLSKLVLTSMMSECAKSFERLPILLHADILRNILYSGVWCKYEYNRLKRDRKKNSDIKE